MSKDQVAFLSSLLAAPTAQHVLQLATDHVTQILDCDVSWTAEVMDDSQLHIRAHTGLRTSQMSLSWCLPVGEGIGGRAAASGQTQQSSNYRHDSRRVPAKKLIDAEEISAVLVTPLGSPKPTFGVLYAAHRKPRSWTPDDVAILELTARSASVRLEQLQGLAHAESEAQRKTRLFEATSSALQSSADFTEALSATDSAQAALDLAASALGLHIVLTDAASAPLFSAGAELIHTNAKAIVPLETADGLLLHVFEPTVSTEANSHHVRAAIHALRLQLLRLCEREAIKEELHGDVLNSLLSGQLTDPETVKRKLTLLGMPQLTRSSRVAVLEWPSIASGGVEKLVADVRTAYPQSQFDFRGRLLVLLLATSDDEATVAHRLGALVRGEATRQNLPGLTAAIGRKALDPREIAISFNEARAAHSAVHTPHAPRAQGFAAEKRFHVVSARSLGLQGVASMPLPLLRSIVNDTLGPLLEQDSSKGTDYLPTLQAYLRHDRHLGKAAAELHLHYNTLRNRIARVEDLLNLKFDQPDDRFRTETAVRMIAVLDALEQSAPQADQT